MRCIDCVNRRRFARDSGVGMLSMFRVCYGHWMRRRSVLHVAGRAALIVLGCLAVFVGLMAWATKVAWDIGGLVGR